MRDNTRKLLYAINEWFESEPPQFIDRSFPYDLIESDLITVLAGVRRSGKTYFLYQIADWLRRKVPYENIIYINFEDDRLYPITGNEIADILGVYRQNFSISKSHKVYLLLDEVQNIPNWERTLRRLYDREKNIKLVITGSSAYLLSSEIASSLRGRTLTHKVYPFSFREFLKAKSVSFEVSRLRYSKKKDEIVSLMKEYMEYGGFPQVVFEKSKSQLLREYYRSILYRDIIEKYSIRNIATFENFLKLTVQNMSSMFSYGKVVNSLKSIGHKASKNTIIDYLEYVEKAFFAFEVSIFSYSIKDQMQYPRKIYLIDTGLRNAVSFRFSEDMGRLAENIAFVELLRRDKEVYYWKDYYGHEVDFVIKNGLAIEQLIQICWFPEGAENTIQREIKGLLRAMKEFKLSSGMVLTEDMYEDREIDNCTIKFRPLWHWLVGE